MFLWLPYMMHLLNTYSIFHKEWEKFNCFHKHLTSSKRFCSILSWELATLSSSGVLRNWSRQCSVSLEVVHYFNFLESMPRSLTSTSAATIVGGPMTFGRTKKLKDNKICCMNLFEFFATDQHATYNTMHLLHWYLICFIKYLLGVHSSNLINLL